MTIQLRHLTPRDLRTLFLWESNREAVTMAAFTRSDPSDRSAFDSHYERIMANPDVMLRAIEEDRRLVGMIGSFTVEGDRELTYWVDPGLWGRGIASAGVQAFLLIEPIRPLFARVARHNLGSATVVARAGFARIGRESAWAEGLRRDVVEDIYRLD
ncbi:GNAT family N-acetyltransferase [Pseudonocardia zijingensis]|uniref:GNAT family N-acetyltransferase n=1 Tax=Pseudonocardia zijingensis TaxID=153376 RepID=A0ABN1N9E0_9PSEU